MARKPNQYVRWNAAEIEILDVELDESGFAADLGGNLSDTTLRSAYLALVKDMTYGEAGGALGVSRNVVAGAVFRARKALGIEAGR